MTFPTTSDRGVTEAHGRLMTCLRLPMRFSVRVFCLATICNMALGCGSHKTDKHPDALPGDDANLVSGGDDSARVDPVDATTSPDISTVKPDGNERSDGIVSRDVVCSDLLVATPDLVNRDPDALACTAAQQSRRNAVDQQTIIPFAETPAVVQDFLTVFLSKEYIEEHLRFVQTFNGTSINTNDLAIDFLDGCYTSSAPGQIEWGVAIYKGKILYVGPSREWRVLIGEEEARQLMTAAGCDASNLGLGWGAEATPIPGVSTYNGGSYYPAWQAGGQDVDVKPGMPSGTYCKGPTCSVHAETGSVSQKPGICASPG